MSITQARARYRVLKRAHDSKQTALGVLNADRFAAAMPGGLEEEASTAMQGLEGLEAEPSACTVGTLGAQASVAEGLGVEGDGCGPGQDEGAGPPGGWQRTCTCAPRARKRTQLGAGSP